MNLNLSNESIKSKVIQREKSKEGRTYLHEVCCFIGKKKMISFQCSDFIVELKFSDEKDFSDSFVDSCWDQISLYHFFITL